MNKYEKVPPYLLTNLLCLGQLAKCLRSPVQYWNTATPIHREKVCKKCGPISKTMKVPLRRIIWRYPYIWVNETHTHGEKSGPIMLLSTPTQQRSLQNLRSNNVSSTPASKNLKGIPTIKTWRYPFNHLVAISPHSDCPSEVSKSPVQYRKLVTPIHWQKVWSSAVQLHILKSPVQYTFSYSYPSTKNVKVLLQSPVQYSF